VAKVVRVGRGTAGAFSIATDVLGKVPGPALDSHGDPVNHEGLFLLAGFLSSSVKDAGFGHLVGEGAVSINAVNAVANALVKGGSFGTWGFGASSSLANAAFVGGRPRAEAGQSGSSAKFLVPAKAVLSSGAARLGKTALDRRVSRAETGNRSASARGGWSADSLLAGRRLKAGLARGGSSSSSSGSGRFKKIGFGAAAADKARKDPSSSLVPKGEGGPDLTKVVVVNVSKDGRASETSTADVEGEADESSELVVVYGDLHVVFHAGFKASFRKIVTEKIVSLSFG